MENKGDLEKEYVKFKEAEALKILGFNERCLFAYDRIQMPCSDLRTNEQKFYGVNYNSSTYTSRPSFSQAFRWFREKYKLSHVIYNEIKIENDSIVIENKFNYDINEYSKKDYNLGNPILSCEYCFSSYEEAELACLRELIEIVNEQE